MLRRHRDARSQSGFTLIELLVVIVILGVLAAVTVFAVDGISDRGTESACKADVETVTGAAEAYQARHGTYAARMSQLVRAGLLHHVPSDENYTIDYQVVSEADRQSVVVSSSFCTGGSADLPAASIRPVDRGDDSAVYCESLSSALQRLHGLEFQALDVDDLTEARRIVRSVEGIAPTDLRTDWIIVVGAVTDMQQVVSATGLSPADLDLLSTGGLPQGFTEDDSDQLAAALSRPTSSRQLQVATVQIRAHARRECGTATGRTT